MPAPTAIRGWASADDGGLRLLALSALIRLALIGFGAWQDSALDVKYTDIDYAVFSDAAGFMAAGGSPYQRSTYRYSPLLAAALLPNVAFPAWGKLLFSVADLAVGWCAFPFIPLRRRPSSELVAGKK
jgi:phosphatidylinositol glycan class M